MNSKIQTVGRTSNRLWTDHHWDLSATVETLNQTAREVILAKDSEIWVYGYYRLVPTRLQWGFYSEVRGILVIYDDASEEITTVFKPKDGTTFLLAQIDSQKINRDKWNI